MYNRYIPEDTSYNRIEVPPSPRGPERPSQPRQAPFRELFSGKEGLSALFRGGGLPGGGEGLSGLLKTFHLEHIDSGDIMLLLILLYLLVEGEDMDLVIALGLVLIMGLGEDEP